MSTELARRAAAGDTSPEILAWVREAMRRHLDGANLDQALRLDRASKVREMYQALRDADALLSPAGEGSTSRRARRLEAAIKRFETRIRPMLARDPGMTLAPIDEALRRAFDTGVRVTGDWRNLFNIIR